jgi:HAD superfamily hydrolase (TIGR01549 family)
VALGPKAVPGLVLFDVDDTIFDHAFTCRAAIAELRSEYPQFRTRTLNQLANEYYRILDTQSYTASRSPAGYGRLRAERFRLLAAQCSWKIERPQAKEISRQYREEYMRLRRPVPGAVTFVRRTAKRARVGMVTNNEYHEQEEKLRFLGLSQVVDPLVVSAEEHVAKPDPRIFRIALERAGARPNETVMVGDSWTNDVLGARAAGIRPVWFNRFELPRPTRHSVEEIRSFLPAEPTEAVVLRRRTPRAGPRTPSPRRASSAL